jgi:hypothetical protein
MHKHLIIGAGKFSHAHIRVLQELNVNNIEITKKTSWTNDIKDQFLSRHPNVNFVFSNLINAENKLVHIVTPSHTHLEILNLCSNAKSIFIEKPSVLFDIDDDFVKANIIYKSKQTIYQNDWFAMIHNFRKTHSKPNKINFDYHVVNNEKIDCITEIISHLIIFLSQWINCNDAIHLIKITQDEYQTQMSLNVNDIEIEINVSLRNKSSNWKIDIDNEHFDNEILGKKLMLMSMENFINAQQPFTDWYKTSWLLHKIRSFNNMIKFNDQLTQYYINSTIKV